MMRALWILHMYFTMSKQIVKYMRSVHSALINMSSAFPCLFVPLTCLIFCLRTANISLLLVHHVIYMCVFVWLWFCAVKMSRLLADHVIYMCLYLFHFVLSKSFIVHQHILSICPIFSRSCPYMCVYLFLLPFHDNKWHIFRQIMLFTFVYLFCCRFMLSRCRIFCQHTAKMAHLSADHVICLCICIVVILCCQDVTSFISILPRWRIFQQVMLFTCVYLLCCHFMLSRWHLSSAYCQDGTSFGRSCYLFVCVSVLLSFYAVKMSHLSSAYCQDGASFGRSCYLRVCICYVVILCCQDDIFHQHTAKMTHLSADHVIYLFVYLFCCHFMLSRCHIFHQHTAKMAHLSADHVIYICVFVLLSFYAIKMSHLLSAYCQDGTSFGRSCYLFVYLYCCHFMLSRCHIFRQHTAKMAHLSAGHVIYVCVSVMLSFYAVKMTSFISILPRWHIFRQIMLFICLCICFVVILCCQDVTSFISILPRWRIFRQVMLFTCVYLLCCHFMLSRWHLSSAYCQDDTSFGRSCYLFVCVSVLLSFYAVKMSHLSSAYCQDGTSFGRSCYLHLCICFADILCYQDVASFVSILPRWHIFRQIMLFVCVSVLLSFYAVKMSHLSSAYCQDGASFGRSCYLHVCICFFGIFLLSICHIFCQHTAKISLLSADHIIYIWVLVLFSFLPLTCHTVCFV